MIDLINRKITDSDVRFWVSAGICFAVGGAFNWLQTGYVFATPMDAFTSITGSAMQVFGWAQLSYKAAWENRAVLGEFRDDIGLNAKKQ